MTNAITSVGHGLPESLIEEIQGSFDVIETEADRDKIQSYLDMLIDEAGEREDHPLVGLITVLGILIEDYESRHVPGL